MKKTFILMFTTMMLSLFSSCETSTEQYYQLTNNTSYPLSGMLCEYDNQDNCINQMSFHLDVGQSTPSILARTESRRVKIFLTDYNQWVAGIYHLNSIFALNIIIDNNTELSLYEP